MSVATFIDGPAMRSEHTSFPVVRGDDLVGMVSLDRVRAEPQARWSTTTIGELAFALDKDDMIDIDANADRALRRMAEEALDQLPVVEDGDVRGYVRQRDILRWLYLQDLDDATSARAG